VMTLTFPEPSNGIGRSMTVCENAAVLTNIRIQIVPLFMLQYRLTHTDLSSVTLRP
jgi:hypothetical protein